MIYRFQSTNTLLVTLVFNSFTDALERDGQVARIVYEALGMRVVSGRDGGRHHRRRTVDADRPVSEGDAAADDNDVFRSLANKLYDVYGRLRRDAVVLAAENGRLRQWLRSVSAADGHAAIEIAGLLAENATDRRSTDAANEQDLADVVAGVRDVLSGVHGVMRPSAHEADGLPNPERKRPINVQVGVDVSRFTQYNIFTRDVCEGRVLTPSQIRYFLSKKKKRASKVQSILGQTLTKI